MVKSFSGSHLYGWLLSLPHIRIVQFLLRFELNSLKKKVYAVNSQFPHNIFMHEMRWRLEYDWKEKQNVYAAA